MKNLRKFQNEYFSDTQGKHGRGRGVHTLVGREEHFTTQLPQGSVKRFLKFAGTSAQNGLPLNTLLTLRWHALWAEGASYPYLHLPARTRIAKTVELLRKFTTNRGCALTWIWVQENPKSEHGGLHWHIAFHSKLEWREELSDYVERHFGLQRLPKFLVDQATQGEIARSEARAWHMPSIPHRSVRGEIWPYTLERETKRLIDYLASKFGKMISLKAI